MTQVHGTNKSSSAAVLAASLNRLGPHGSVQVSTLTSHHQLQYLLPRTYYPCGPNRSAEAASTAANDDLLDFRLAQTHVALTGPTRQQVLLLLMTY